MLRALQIITVMAVLFCWQVSYGQLLDAYGIIQGIVTDNYADSTIEGVELSAWDPDEDTLIDIDSTDSQGRYTLIIPLDDIYSDTVNVRAEREGYVPADRDVIVCFGYVAIENFSLMGLAITGTVTDLNFEGIPIESVFVSATQNGTPITDDFTNSLGSYRLDVHYHGTYDSVSFTHAEFFDTTILDVVVDPAKICTLNVKMDRVIWHVSEDGNDNNDGSKDSPFATIQHAINYSNTDDTVLVAPGIYTGEGNRDIRFGGRRITVKSKEGEGPESTIIDCEGTGQRRGFEIINVDTFTVIDGFTIMNGNNTSGGGIYCFNKASAKIINCIIKGNIGGTSGGGIGISYRSNPVIRNCVIDSNVATFGGGIHIANRCSTTVDNCIISNNNAEKGGGIYSDESQPVIENCTITLNYADSSGGGIYYEQSDSTIRKSILWGNDPDEIDTISSSPIVEYCDIQGGWGVPPDTSLNCDPSFCNADSSDFDLEINSCCLDYPEVGDYIGALGLGCGNGVIEGTVTNSLTGDSLEGVSVQATLSGDTTGTDTTDTNGKYYIEVFIPDSTDMADVRFTCSSYTTIDTFTVVTPGDSSELNVEMDSSVCCDYKPGDINGDGNVMGNDVTYCVRYFKGIGPPPPDSCWNDSTETWLYSAADANGNCEFTGSDCTYLIGYFKDYNDSILWCPQTPPCDTLPPACPPGKSVLGKEGQPIIRDSNLNRK